MVSCACECVRDSVCACERVCGFGTEMADVSETDWPQEYLVSVHSPYQQGNNRQVVLFRQ